MVRGQTATGVVFGGGDGGGVIILIQNLGTDQVGQKRLIYLQDKQVLQQGIVQQQLHF